MSPREKIANYIASLDAQGIHPLTSAPLLYRILWRFGIYATPPLSNSFGKNFVLMGPLFGISIGAGVRFAGLPLPAIGPIKLIETAPTYAAVAGVALGALVAMYFAWRRKGLVLPDWD